MVAASIPVFGTALSFAINTTVSLAEGEPIDQALLDAVGGALPEQPASGMAFNAAVAIGRGESLSEVAIDALPLDRSVKDLLKVADAVVEGIASGEAVTDVTLRAIRDQLPPEAQAGMDLARRVIDGEDVSGLILTQAEQFVVDGVRREAQGLVDAAASQGPEVIAAARAKSEALFQPVRCRVRVPDRTRPAQRRCASGPSARPRRWGDPARGALRRDLRFGCRDQRRRARQRCRQG